MGVEMTSRSPGRMPLERATPRIDRAMSSKMSGGYCAAEDRVEEPAVELAVDPACGVEVGGVGRVDRVGDREVQRDAEVQRRVARPQLADRLAVAQQQVVRRPASPRSSL